jgi:uncharacterized membrane protein
VRLRLWAELLQWALIATMFAAAALFWQSAPDLIPIHWNLEGNVDGYGGKFEGLLLLPLIALGLYLLLAFLPRLGPRYANYARFETAYTVIRIGALALLALIYGFVLLWINGVELNAARVIPVIVGGLLMVIGFYLNRVEPNWFVGIRTPWTLTSDRSWRKTHELGRWVFLLMGIALILTDLLRPTLGAELILMLILGGTVVLVAYSYLIWREDRDGESTPLA